MHLIVPFAGVLSEAGRHSLASLRLPPLAALLARMGAPERDAGDAFALSPPHERALARALGWAGGDGRLPLAARAAAADGIDPGDLAWALLTPVHQHVGTEQVSLADPTALRLDEAASREVFELVRPLFESEGFVLAWGAPLRWYAAHEALAEVPSASLDRVVGRNIDAWLPSHKSTRLIRRLQNEVQMLLHTHALNERREAAGQLTVNSFWYSGCGVAQPVTGAEPVVDDRLRESALQEDWPAWAAAWQALADGPVTQLLKDGPGSVLTLCGERDALRFAWQPRPWWQRLFARPVDTRAVLESL